jgi:hypothetical protein
VALYDPRSRGTEAYFELAGELLARNNMESSRAAQRKRSLPPTPERGGSKVTFLALFLTGLWINMIAAAHSLT